MKGEAGKVAGQNNLSSVADEKLLQFIWQFQYFNQSALSASTGEPVEIIDPGRINRDQGPDFLNARIRMGNTLFAGSVEIHFLSSQWDMHRHEDDPNYSNVILHVVFQDDRKMHSRMPVLELEHRIPGIMLETYERLLNTLSEIPCAGSNRQVKPITWEKWAERLVVERLTRKSLQIEGLLEQNHYHWEEVFWWMLARNFGIRVNSEAFEAIARSLPLNIIGRHRNLVQQLEALLLGQGNLLHRSYEDDYAKLLWREYSFLKKKYGLRPVSVPILFMRMRPCNFPSLRLAQLAMLLHQRQGLFSCLVDCNDMNSIRHFFEVTANDFWHYHYNLDVKSGFSKKSLGKDTINNILVNTVAPFFYAFGRLNGRPDMQERAMALLEAVPAENNRITRMYGALGLGVKHAFHSQGIHELKSQYCDEKQCLRCSIGLELLKIE